MYRLIGRRTRCVSSLLFPLVAFLIVFHLYSGEFQISIPKISADPQLVPYNGFETSFGDSTSLANSNIKLGEGADTLDSTPNAGIGKENNHSTTTKVLPVSPTPTQPTGVIVAAVNTKADLKWVTTLEKSMWKLHRYNYDDPSPPPETSFPKNKGHEAMPYLSYIISNYDKLPDYSVFIHGHRIAWHQEIDVVSIINGIKLPALDKAGYVSLRCDWFPSCPRELRPFDRDTISWGPIPDRTVTEGLIGKVWPLLFGSDVEVPRTISSQCCAQFFVTRKAIERYSKSDYERMRKWLLDTELDDDLGGRMFEKLWAYIFTGEPVHCPPPPVCACEFFGECGPGDWTIPPEGLQKWPDELDRPKPGT